MSWSMVRWVSRTRLRSFSFWRVRRRRTVGKVLMLVLLFPVSIKNLIVYLFRYPGMPPAAAREKENLGPLHTVPQTVFPRPRQEDCVPLHPLLNCNFYKNERSASSTWLTV